MDCDTARLFLQFCRPGGTDLDGPEEAELEEHLAHCSGCHALSLSQRRLDQHLGQAMRAVEPPRGLRERLLDRLAAERSERHRRWFANSARVLAAAAAILLLIWGGWYAWFYRPVPRIDADHVLISFNVSRPDRDRANQILKQLGARPGASPHFKEAFLIAGPALALLPGYERPHVRVPVFVYAQQATRDTAVVFVVDERQHRIDDPENSPHGYPYKLAVFRPDHGPYAYLVFHNGKDADSWEKWLYNPEAESR